MTHPPIPTPGAGPAERALGIFLCLEGNEIKVSKYAELPYTRIPPPKRVKKLPDADSGARSAFWFALTKRGRLLYFAAPRDPLNQYAETFGIAGFGHIEGSERRRRFRVVVPLNTALIADELQIHLSNVGPGGPRPNGVAEPFVATVPVRYRGRRANDKSTRR